MCPKISLNPGLLPILAEARGVTLQAKWPFFGGTLRDGSPLAAVTLRDEALGVARNESMFITVRGVALRGELRVPLRGRGAKDTVFGAGVSTMLAFSLAGHGGWCQGFVCEDSCNLDEGFMLTWCQFG